jgi:glycogen debranching enzyme
VDENTKCNFDAELCMSKFFWVKDIPFNTVLIENLRALGHIASLLKHSDGEHFANLHAELIAEAMRERMFKDGLFWSHAGKDYERIPVATWAHFAPLFAGLYSPEEAAKVVQEHLLNPETFWAPYGVRTVSKAEQSYRPQGYKEGFSWRGPVWMAPHWFIYRGLLRYGFKKEAAQVREKSIALLQKSGFRECFNPETGEGQGAEQFTWGALVLDMVDE